MRLRDGNEQLTEIAAAFVEPFLDLGEGALIAVDFQSPSGKAEPMRGHTIVHLRAPAELLRKLHCAVESTFEKRILRTHQCARRVDGSFIFERAIAAERIVMLEPKAHWIDQA